MAELPFLIMDRLQAARLREETAGDDNRLEPVLITTGPNKGDYALARRVMEDAAHAARRDMFLMLQEKVLDASTAFYVAEDEAEVS